MLMLSCDDAVVVNVAQVVGEDVLFISISLSLSTADTGQDCLPVCSFDVRHHRPHH